MGNCTDTVKVLLEEGKAEVNVADNVSLQPITVQREFVAVLCCVG